MGARISIDFSEVCTNPDIKVTISSAYIWPETRESLDTTVQLQFKEDKVLSFDLVQGPQLTLEADFNFFRDPERHTERMRLLFEHSIPFTVVPG